MSLQGVNIKPVKTPFRADTEELRTIPNSRELRRIFPLFILNRRSEEKPSQLRRECQCPLIPTSRCDIDAARVDPDVSNVLDGQCQCRYPKHAKTPIANTGHAAQPQEQRIVVPRLRRR